MALYTTRITPWTWLAPLLAWGIYAALPGQMLFTTAALIAAVIASVHHAEVIAHKLGEPLGTLVLAFSVTVIEVALILTLMLKGGEAASGLARDTVFSSVMIILNGIIGICLLIGGKLHHEQRFGLQGISAALATLAAIVVLTLVLPNYTNSAKGPYYNEAQLIFIAIISLVLYIAFVFMQTVRHRDYFVAAHEKNVPHAPVSTRIAFISFGLLVACLAAVVLLAKAASPGIESALMQWNAPKATVGILIALIVLLPEGFASLKAARKNRMQTSLNLALGSALASIGLTIPAVAVLSIMMDIPLALGIDIKSIALLVLSLFVASLSLGTGRTTMLQGIIHLVLFSVYLFMSFVP